VESIFFLSIPIVLLFGGLVLFIIFYRKGRVEKEDYSKKISDYESLYKQGKLSKEEFNQIRFTLMKKQGIEIPQELIRTLSPPKPIRPSMNVEEKKDSQEKNNDNRTNLDSSIRS